MAIANGSAQEWKAFTDLPLETQKHIIAYVGRKALFNLQTLSRHFHALASAEIYRHLDFNFISSETEDSGTITSRGADALQTILASEHDYGQYIRSFRMGAVGDRLFVGHGSIFQDPLIMTRLLWDSKTDPSKFLNTALLLMARKASILETFKWDAPIELSGAVYQTLHKTASLRHLLIRLDVQPSPKIGVRQPPPPGHHHPPGVHPPGNPFHVPAAGGPSHSYVPAPETTVSKRKKGGESKFWTNRRAFSGFRTLNTLEIMGISNLESLPEIAQCIKASSASLKSITLTLSAELAKKARKPTTTTVAAAAVDEATDSELDEDEDASDEPPYPNASATQPANEADIREEKLAQEGILATVFDLQDLAQAGKKLEKKLSLSGGRCLEEQDAQALQNRMNNLMKLLQDGPIPSSNDPSSQASRLEKFRMLREIADLYITTHGGPMKKSSKVATKPHPRNEAKKSLASSKPLNPLASGFKPSGFSNQFAGLMDDLPAVPDLANPSLANTVKSPSYGVPGSYFHEVSSPPDVPSLPSVSGMTNGKYVSADMPSFVTTYAGSYPPPSVAFNSVYPYDYGLNGSGTQTPTLSSSMYHSYPNAVGSSQPMFSPPPPIGHLTFSNKSTTSLASKPSKAKKHPQKKVEPAKKNSVTSSDAESDTESKMQASSQPLFAVKPDDEPCDTMDVDIVHPDEDMTDPGEDQETADGLEETNVHTPRKRFKIRESDSPPLNAATRGSPSATGADQVSNVATLTAADAMQDYIRTKHGLQLEELRLHWIPMRASIVGRALDLTSLQRITLLDVGPQDAFWALLVRLTSPDNRIAFKSIHTDNVSFAFTKFLATFGGLEELFMHERNSKAEPDSALLVDITGMRKFALTWHITTLKRLMIRNDRDESWDVDTKTLQFLALKGHALKELAFSLKMPTYHVLIQMFPGFKSLHALHLIALRTPDRSLGLQLESLNFAVDSLSHCHGVKLRYLALADQVNSLETRPEQFRKHLKIVMERRKIADRKGKGKAVDSFSAPNEPTDDASDRELDDVLAEVTAGEKKLRFSTRFDEVKGVKIFSKEMRSGKL